MNSSRSAPPTSKVFKPETLAFMGFVYEVWDYTSDKPYFAKSIQSALRYFRTCADAKIVRLKDEVIVAQTATSDDAIGEDNHYADYGRPGGTSARIGGNYYLNREA